MPRFIYLHGFASGPQSRKARFFGEKLSKEGLHLEAPDLSSGNFFELTIGGQISVLERLAAGNAVTLIGSSLGGYLAALYAARHPETQRVLLLAPAFGFNQRWESMVGAAGFERWRETGKLSVHHYAAGRHCDLGFQIYEESRKWEPFPSFPQPAQIYHGRKDTVVLPEVSEEYSARHPNTMLTLLDSDHELTDVLPEIWRLASPFLLAAT